MKPWLSLARACYRLMLRAYPRGFRAEFAREMEAALAQALAEAAEVGPVHAAAVWGREVWEWPAAALHQHRLAWGRLGRGAAVAWLPAGTLSLMARVDYSWVSAALFVGVVAAWGWRVAQMVREQPGPFYPMISAILALGVYAAGLIAFARSHTSGQRVVALQASLVLSPGTGLLVSYLFWSLPGLSHGPGSTTLTLLLVYAAFSLPWLLLMFVPGLLTAARRALSPKRARWSIDWRLAGFWALATTAGWLVPHLVSISDWPVQVASAWLLMLTAPAVLQGLVLRRRLHGGSWQTLAGWVAVSASGLIGGIYLMASRQLLDLYLNGRDGLDQVLGYSTLGAALGVAQWLVLRRWTPRAHGWVLANVLAWPAGWGLAQLLATYWQGPRLSGAEPALIAGLASLATGAALGWLLPRTEAGDG